MLKIWKAKIKLDYISIWHVSNYIYKNKNDMFLNN